MKPPHRNATLGAGLLLAVLAARPGAAAAATVVQKAGIGSELVLPLTPAAGTTLVAGSTVLFAWEPGPALAALPRAEEWELFVSLDGGRTYLARVTPHLDLAIRRVTVRVPEVPSADVRLMVRVGDEREEREQVLAGRYRIVPSPGAGSAWRRRQLERGEPARAGAPGVVVWVEGNRDGSGWVEREAAPATAAWAPAVTAGQATSLALGPPPRPAPKLSRPPLSAAGFDLAVGPALGSPSSAPPPAPSLCRLCRRNE